MNNTDKDILFTDIVVDFSGWGLPGQGQHGKKYKDEYYYLLFNYYVKLYLCHFIKERGLYCIFGPTRAKARDLFYNAFARLCGAPVEILNKQLPVFMSNGVLDFNKMIVLYCFNFNNEELVYCYDFINKELVSFNISNYNIMLNVYNGLFCYPRRGGFGVRSVEDCREEDIKIYATRFLRFFNMVIEKSLIQIDEEILYLQQKIQEEYNELLLVLKGFYDVTEDEKSKFRETILRCMDEFVNEMRVCNSFLYRAYDFDHTKTSKDDYEESLNNFILYIEQNKIMVVDFLLKSYNFYNKRAMLNPRKYNFMNLYVDFNSKECIYFKLLSHFFEKSNMFELSGLVCINLSLK